MARTDRFEIAPLREHHLANVTPLNRPVAVNPRHPSVRSEMFDQDQVAPDQFVKLSRVEAKCERHLPTGSKCGRPSAAFVMGQHVCGVHDTARAVNCSLACSLRTVQFLRCCGRGGAMSGAQGLWQVQIRSQMLPDQWNDLSDHSTEAAALQSVDRYQVTHPGREYRVLRFVVAEIIDPDIRRRPRPTESGICSCTEHETYRQLDRDCPTHGDAADARRRQGNEGS